MTSLSRVTQGAISRQTTDGLQASLAKLQQIQNRLSTGKQINRPSDDPSGAVAAMTFRGGVRRTEQYARNAADGLGWLGTADDTLTGMLDDMRRARDLTLQGANAAMSPDERSALAAEIDTIRAGLIGSANTEYLGRPIFAGNYVDPSGTTVAFDANGVYKGDTGNVMRTVAPGQKVAVNLVGSQVFGAGSTGLFGALAKISADLRSGTPAAIANLTSGDLPNLDAAVNNVQNTLAQVGARYHRVETMQTQSQTTILSLQSGLAEVEDVDLPKTITDLQLQQVSYQSALAASAKVIQPSLVDFLR